MSEIAVKFATRFIERQWSTAIGKSLLKSLTEPITNCDDSYRRISESIEKNTERVFPIEIFIDKYRRLVRITDLAQGMTTEELKSKFREYGAAKSGAYEGYSSRGIFGQGISDVLFFHSEGKIKSIKDGEASICSFYKKNRRPYISIEKEDGSIDKIAKLWGINADHGTVVEFVLDSSTSLHDYENLVKRLRVFYMLRLINASDRREVRLIYKERKRIRQSLMKYRFPQGELVENKKFTMQFEDYEPVQIDVVLYKSPTSLQTTGDERENGLLVSDDKEAVYAQTFFGWDNLPGADKFFGFMKLTGAREIILDKINHRKHPEAILSDSRDGFNLQHEFYKKLAVEVKDWLYPILNEERRKRTNEGVSETTLENHRKAFDELNKLYAQLTGDDINGFIRSKKKARPVGGMEFARNNITITAGKRYGLQLIIDMRVIKNGAKIELNSSKKKIGFSPNVIIVDKSQENKEEILTKNIIVSGEEPRTADTLEAKCGEHSASVVVSIVSEELFYPEKGIAFYPDYFKALVNVESSLHLFVDLDLVKPGSKIFLSSTNNDIVLKKRAFIVTGRTRTEKNIAKIDIPFVGQKNNASGVVEANFKEYPAQCRIDIKDRVKPSPSGPMGKFKDWDFDEGVPRQMQTAYDSIGGSPTQGYILINSNHPINHYYFGENPKKKDIETSHKAQLYLAELILNESLGIMIPEAYQQGAIPRNYGPEYDIPVYIAQKKFELGPVIYNRFVEEEESAREIKREKQLEEIKQVRILSDEDLVSGLGDREKHIIEMRFGLNNQRSHTLDEISQKYNITRERVRQIINKSIAQNQENYDYIENKDSDFPEVDGKNTESEVEKIISAVESFYNLEKGATKKRTRKSEVARARQITIFLLRDLLKLSFPAIARIFGLNHTTIMYAFEKISDEIEKSKIIKGQIDAIEVIIK